MAEVHDVIVVGAGVEGSATAYHVASRGASVILLEQFDAQHTRGSSHGCSRITRRAYTQPYYVHMMDEAFRIWDQVEKKSDTKLYTQTGILVFGEAGSDVDDVITSLKTHGVDHEEFPGSEANRRYPDQLNLPSHLKCVIEKDGGILHAHKAVAALQRLFKESGGELLDNHQVTEILPGPVVTVVTNRGTFMGRKVVVTAGAWTGALMGKLGLELPFKVKRAEVFYWKVENPDIFSAKNFPTTWLAVPKSIECANGGTKLYYSLPIQEYAGLLKVCASHGGPEVSPDTRDADPAPVSTDHVRAFIQKHFKGVSTTPSIYESCIYTDTPDYNPVLDRHPVHHNILIGAGFSGHGFKLAPVVGKILCELALGLPPSYDLTPFRVDRFIVPINSTD